MISISDKFQKTITKEIIFEGIGLHSGVSSKLILKPAPADFGIKFYIGDTIIPAQTKYVDTTIRGTNLQKNDESIMTIEHLLSALYAFTWHISIKLMKREIIERLADDLFSILNSSKILA